MTKQQAREILYDFVEHAKCANHMPKQDASDIFDMCLGIEEEYEREAYDLVGQEVYPHIIEVVYSDW